MISLVYESSAAEIDALVYLACGCAGRGRHEEPRRCLIERSRQQRKSYAPDASAKVTQIMITRCSKCTSPEYSMPPLRLPRALRLATRDPAES